MSTKNKARVLLVVWLVTCVVLLLLTFNGGAAKADNIPPTNGRTLPACTSEDGSFGPKPCVWLAVVTHDMPAVGNGSGDSFRVYRSGRIKTITDRRAYQLLNGMPNHDKGEPQEATASTVEHDKRHCVTIQEFDRTPWVGKAAVEDWYDTRGVTVYADVFMLLKHYPVCNRSTGWVSVMYTPQYDTIGYDVNWRQFHWTCTIQILDGHSPRVPCDDPPRVQPGELVLY